MNVLLLRWDTKPDKRIRGTFRRPASTRRTSFYADDSVLLLDSAMLVQLSFWSVEPSEIRPREWAQRISTCPSPLGKTEDAITDLSALLRDLGPNGRPYATEVTIESSGRSINVREATRYLPSVGLIQQTDDECLAVTELAQTWLSSADDAVLMHILHAGVQYFGELLAVLDSVGGSASNAELLDAGRVRYAMNWASLDPIRRRTSWLRAANLVEQYEGQVRITDAGKSFIQSLDIAKPLASITFTSNVSAPSPMPEVLALLAKTTDETLQRRDRVSNYLATLDGSAILAIREFVQKLRVRSTEATFVQHVESRCRISASSAAMMLATLRKLGLVERVGVNAFQATSLGAAWSEDGNAVDLIHIAHCRLWGLGEVLALMDGSPKGGQHLLKAVGLPSTARERLRLLAEANLVQKFDQARYVITPLGLAVREELPKLAVAIPGELEHETKSRHEAPAKPSAEAVAEELELASVTSDDSTRLEKAVATALELLGLAEVTILGGQGRTDVIGTLPRPWHDGSAICFDAKSSSIGMVPESRVSFGGLAEHRQKHGGRWSVLVGPAFHHRVHAMAKSDGQVSVLDVAYLAKAVMQNAHAPLLPEQLRELFAPSHSCERVRSIEQLRHDADETRNLLSLVLTALEEEARNPLDDGWLSPRDVVRACRPQSQLTVTEVSELLSGLSTLPWVGGIEHKGQQQFRLIAPADDLLARVRFLALGMRLE
ncbi:hypothetical protein E1258_18030 [Micromonospora sp. KC207]|uniref:hypothetical protein n=1 Tax=Micromonospora sp. KC207 TaxID=2530377 RepID=UPI00104BD4E7|nr:hypothetical protein [Micromonospora sp. KC207]TDC59429.1 hypothetical protein E1258_18030 [Micromonospora sp. KC207]